VRSGTNETALKGRDERRYGGKRKSNVRRIPDLSEEK
jgi:hypothetical protein